MKAHKATNEKKANKHKESGGKQKEGEQAKRRKKANKAQDQQGYERRRR